MMVNALHFIFRNCIPLLALFFIVSCGKVSPEGNIELKSEKLPDFTEIVCKGKFRVFLVNAAQNSVDVETYPNVFENLNISVKEQKLTISERSSTKGVDFYNITIYSRKNPSAISLSDSVEFNVSGEINTRNIAINLKNNAKFIGSVRAKKAEVEMKDTSLANFKGFTEKAYLKISDTANLVAPYWLIDNLDIDFRNGGYAEVNVKDTLKGKISNTAKFLYYNDPIRAFKIDRTANVENKKLE